MPVTLPNLISIARLVLVPVIIWLIAEGRLDIAFVLFVAAGVSDALDGYIARRFGLRSELGAYLDPLADKALLVSVFITLGIFGVLPRWLVILVVSRDVLIVGALVLSWMLGRPYEVRPILISKANTVAQIALVVAVLWQDGFAVSLGPLVGIGIVLVAALTVASAAAYLVAWFRHMSDEGGDDAGESSQQARR